MVIKVRKDIDSILTSSCDPRLEALFHGFGVYASELACGLSSHLGLGGRGRTANFPGRKTGRATERASDADGHRFLAGSDGLARSFLLSFGGGGGLSLFGQRQNGH